MNYGLLIIIRLPILFYHARCDHSTDYDHSDDGCPDLPAQCKLLHQGHRCVLGNLLQLYLWSAHWVRRGPLLYAYSCRRTHADGKTLIKTLAKFICNMSWARAKKWAVLDRCLQLCHWDNSHGYWQVAKKSLLALTVSCVTVVDRRFNTPKSDLMEYIGIHSKQSVCERCRLYSKINWN